MPFLQNIVYLFILYTIYSHFKMTLYYCLFTISSTKQQKSLPNYSKSGRLSLFTSHLAVLALVFFRK